MEKIKKLFLMIFLFSVICISSPVLITNGAMADEVIILNGDRISGTVVKLEGGRLTLKTEYAGKLEIQVDKIKNIVTDDPAEVHLIGGEVLKGRLKPSVSGKLAVESTPEQTGAMVEMSVVAAINPPVKPPIHWTGSITIGGVHESGNTERRNFSTAADASLKGKRNRFGIRFLFNYADEEEAVTVRNIYGSLKHDYFFTKKVYGYLGLEMLKDRFKDLNMRTSIGPGAGYQVWDDPVKSLLFEAGLVYLDEDRRDDDDESWVAGRLATAFRYTLLKYFTFSDRLEIYPSLEDNDDFNLRNEAVILSPIAAGWSLKLANILEYDNSPPENVSKSDLLWTLGLQYSH